MLHRVIVDGCRNEMLLHTPGTVDKLLLLAYIAFVFHLQLDLFCYGFSQHGQDCKQDPRLISAHCRGRTCPYPVFSLFYPIFCSLSGPIFSLSYPVFSISGPVRHPVLCSISYPVPCYKLSQGTYLLLGDRCPA